MSMELVLCLNAMYNFIVETFDSLWGGRLARPVWTGETPIPQDFQIKLHIACLTQKTD